MVVIKMVAVMDPKIGLIKSVIFKIGMKENCRDRWEPPNGWARSPDATGLVVALVWSMYTCISRTCQTHKEDILLTALAAAVGGFTEGFRRWPIPTDHIRYCNFRWKVLASAAKENLHIHTVATVTKNFDGQHLTDFEGLLAAKVGFSDDVIPLQSILEEAKRLGPLLVCMKRTLSWMVFSFEWEHCQGTLPCPVRA